MKKMCFYLPIVIVFVFIAIVSWYIDDSTADVRMYPIGIITGICVLTQLIMCFFTVKNIIKKYHRLKSIIFLGVEVSSIIVMGYLFIVWMMVI